MDDVKKLEKLYTESVVNAGRANNKLYTEGVNNELHLYGYSIHHGNNYELPTATEEMIEIMNSWEDSETREISDHPFHVKDAAGRIHDEGHLVTHPGWEPLFAKYPSLRAFAQQTIQLTNTLKQMLNGSGIKVMPTFYGAELISHMDMGENEQEDAEQGWIDTLSKYGIHVSIDDVWNDDLVGD